MTLAVEVRIIEIGMKDKSNFRVPASKKCSADLVSIFATTHPHLLEYYERKIVFFF